MMPVLVDAGQDWVDPTCLVEEQQNWYQYGQHILAEWLSGKPGRSDTISQINAN